jgi:hypothetical protein
MDVGMVSGFKTKLQLYTVPGQVFYNSTRKLVLKGVDGVVFVVDSQTAMLDACKESYQNLEENLRELGLNLDDIPTVFQWNKRDLRNVVPIDVLEAAFNPKGTPSFQSVASDGSGVFETLRGITKLALSHIKIHVLGETHAVAAPVPEPPPPPEPPPQGIEALTLSDLPSVTDLLDLEGPIPPDPMEGSTPLTDDDDESGLFIEAPLLPEPPEAATEPIGWALESEARLPPAASATGDSVGSTLTEAGRVLAADFIQASPAHEPAAEPTPATPEPAHGPEGEAGPPAAVVDPVPRPSKPTHRVDPLAALASLKMEAKRTTVKPKAVDHRIAINSLLGELTQAGRSAQASVLRMDVPPDAEGPEVEVVVQLRRQGQVLAEGMIHHPMPGKGSMSKLSIEFKRS